MIVPSPQASIKDAFVAWMVDAPPIAHCCKDPVDFGTFGIGQAGEWPVVRTADAQYPIVGVSGSGWLSIADLGWRFFHGNSNDFLITFVACNTAQAAHLSMPRWFDGAMRRLKCRCEPNLIGGLPTIETEDGHHWVRLDDISRIDVKAAFNQYLTACDGENMHHLQYKFGTYKMDETFADAEAWWRFARTWAG